MKICGQCKWWAFYCKVFSGSVLGICRYSPMPFWANPQEAYLDSSWAERCTCFTPRAKTQPAADAAGK
jgi:hypothetical protein